MGHRNGWRGQLGSLVLLVAVAVLILRPWEAQPSEGPATTNAFVVRVVDGDTIEAQVGDRVEDVRYIGVDTPETVKPNTPVQCFGPQAHELNARLLGAPGAALTLRFDRELRDR